jgi:hypothetical protein
MGGRSSSTRRPSMAVRRLRRRHCVRPFCAHARGVQHGLYPRAQCGGQCLACQGRGVAAWAGATATCAPVRRQPGWVAGAVTADAWRERDDEEGRWTRRPISLHKPRGARGASVFMPSPRHSFLAGTRDVVQPGAESARRLNTISRSPV